MLDSTSSFFGGRDDDDDDNGFSGTHYGISLQRELPLDSADSEALRLKLEDWIVPLAEEGLKHSGDIILLKVVGSTLASIVVPGSADINDQEAEKSRIRNTLTNAAKPSEGDEAINAVGFITMCYQDASVKNGILVMILEHRNGEAWMVRLDKTSKNKKGEYRIQTDVLDLQKAADTNLLVGFFETTKAVIH